MWILIFIFLDMILYDFLYRHSCTILYGTVPYPCRWNARVSINYRQMQSINLRRFFVSPLQINVASFRKWCCRFGNQICPHSCCRNHQWHPMTNSGVHGVLYSNELCQKTLRLLPSMHGDYIRYICWQIGVSTSTAQQDDQSDRCCTGREPRIGSKVKHGKSLSKYVRWMKQTWNGWSNGLVPTCSAQLVGRNSNLKLNSASDLVLSIRDHPRDHPREGKVCWWSRTVTDHSSPLKHQNKHGSTGSTVPLWFHCDFTVPLPWWQ